MGREGLRSIRFLPALVVVIPVAQFQLDKSPFSKSILGGQPCVKALYDSTNNDKERKRHSFFINGVGDRWLGVPAN